MKGKYRILILTTFAVLALSLASPAHSAGSPTFYLRTDKPAYVPGDTGSLIITIRNEGDQAFTVKNMTISYPWLSYLNDHWDGNVTINNISTALAQGQAYNTQQSFTIPTDGRAYRFSSGTVKIGTDIGGGGGTYKSGSFTVTMQAPTYTPVGVSTSFFSIVLVAILGVATVLLFLVNQALRRPKPVTH